MCSWPVSVAAAVAFAMLSLPACAKESSPAKAAQPQTLAAAAPAQGPAGNAIQGVVTEKIDAAQYSYLKLRTSSGEVWTAVVKTDKKVGDEVTVVGAAWMEGFKSATLNRTWDRIAFGTLADANGPEAQLPPGHPPTGAARPPPGADVGSLKVAKASGPQGRTVADVWAQRAQLKDKSVAVRGKVVKATNGVMGKNWLHLRDGTGEGETSDLTVTTEGTAAVGATVLVSGTVKVDRDLGSGYHYDVIVEDARIEEK